MSTKEPTAPHIDAPTLEWFSYYRRLEKFLRKETDRLRPIEDAAIRVTRARRNGVVTDQASLDALDEALRPAAPQPEKVHV